MKRISITAAMLLAFVTLTMAQANKAINQQATIRETALLLQNKQLPKVIIVAIAK